MSSAELAVLVLVGVGAIAGLILYILWPDKPPLLPEKALNDSIVAQQWTGGLDPSIPTPGHLPTPGGIDAPG